MKTRQTRLFQIHLSTVIEYLVRILALVRTIVLKATQENNARAAKTDSSKTLKGNALSAKEVRPKS